MSDFDRDFEMMRLTMLGKQYPDVVAATGKVIFYAEDKEDRLMRASWMFESDVFEKMSESGFKLHLMELLDNFIEYRGQCNELPKKIGVVCFDDGNLSIEWLADDFI